MKTDAPKQIGRGAHRVLAGIGYPLLLLLIGKSRTGETTGETRVRAGGMLLIVLTLIGTFGYGLPKLRSGETEAQFIFMAFLALCFILFVVNLLLSYHDSVQQSLKEKRMRQKEKT